MTGFPDDRLDGPDGPGSDPLESLLRPPVGHLPPPSGAFTRIRRRAGRRRMLRAAAGGTAAVAVIAGGLYVAGVLVPRGGDEVVGPPASNSTTAPPTSAPTPPPTSPTGSGGVGAAVGGQGSPSTPGDGSTPPASSPGTDTTPMCTASQLTASLGGSEAGAGHLYRYLVLTNSGAAACHITGYPGVSLLDADGRQIGQPATRHAMDYSPVVLDPGGSASATIHTINQQGSCLPTSVKVKIYPPGSRQSLKIAGKITNCDDLLEITPFAAGTSGNFPG